MSKTPKEGSIKKTVLSLVVETRFVEPTVFTLTGRRIEQQPLQIQNSCNRVVKVSDINCP